MYGPEGLLFCERPLLDVINERNFKVIQEIDSIPEGQFTRMDHEELVSSLYQKYALSPIVLDIDSIETFSDEAKIDIRNDPLRMVRDRSRPHYVKGVRVTLAIPFKGDPIILRCAPSNISIQNPVGFLVDSEIRMSLEGLDFDPKEARAQFQQNIANIQQYIAWGEGHVNGFTRGLSERIRGRINERREKLNQNDKLAEAVGFRVRSRRDAPSTYAVPVQRKKVSIAKFAPVGKPIEPFLEDSAYESILDSIGSMARVKELNPKAFAEMNEESLRFVLLVPLNLHYEGQATGETFNWEGKTDIIIKAGGRNIFIAECLVWAGPQYFREKIDQLLRYVSWRDTKTAIIVFNRQKEMSRVLELIPAEVQSHPNFVRTVMTYRNETGFRFVLYHRDDPKRELTVTVLVFHVPV